MKLLGLASILLTWLAIAIVLIQTQRDVSKSISHHAALHKSRHLVFATLITLSLVSMWIFMTGWIVPVLMLPSWFTILVGIVIALEFIATWVPLTEGWKYKVHQATSYGAALLIPVLLGCMSSSPAMSMAASAVTTAAIAAMISLFLLYFFVRVTHEHHLIYQSAYIAVFHFSILSVMYFG